MSKVLIISVFCLLSVYLLWPSPLFPVPPIGSLQSQEPADTESVLRRSYFTNLSREEIMNHYEKHFKSLISYRLNYPPEEAQTLIRDQTRSSYLQEIVHPWRESLYVSGFVPIKENDQIYRNGLFYLNKITVRYIPSHKITRLTVLLMTLLIILALKYEHRKS